MVDTLIMNSRPSKLDHHHFPPLITQVRPISPGRESGAPELLSYRPGRRDGAHPQHGSVTMNTFLHVSGLIAVVYAYCRVVLWLHRTWRAIDSDKRNEVIP